LKDRKKALITGITGQDGAYLAEFLINKGYEVHGIKRRSSSFNTDRIDHLYQDPHDGEVSLFLHYGDLTDSLSILRVVQEVEPDEIYNLGAQSHVAVSFETPEYTADTVATGALRLLEAIRISGLTHKTKFYQASTSELYGMVQEIPQKETTPFYPRSPYAVAKLYAYWITINYREAYGIYACNGILFNHESPIRGETFVTRKITRGLSRIMTGLQEVLYLGNLDAKRDWGHARDYVEMQWLMLQQDTPDDFCISTGQQYSVRDFINVACDFLGVNLDYEGSGDNEYALIKSITPEKFYFHLDESKFDHTKLIGKKIISVDKRYYRPTEVDTLLGDPSKAKNILGWEPKISFDNIVSEMMASDLRIAHRDFYSKEKGFKVSNSITE